MCDGVGLIHRPAASTDCTRELLWVEDEIVLRGHVEAVSPARVVWFRQEWQLTFAQSLPLASPATPRLDG